MAKRTSDKYQEDIQSIEKILQDERILGIEHRDLYLNFMKKCDIEINNLYQFIDLMNKNCKSVWVYGASTKGNCLLQYSQLDVSKLEFAVERNLKKVGRMTSTGIPISTTMALQS